MIWIVLLVWLVLGMSRILWLCNDEARWLAWYSSPNSPTVYERILMFPASMVILLFKVIGIFLTAVFTSHKK